MLFFPNRFFRVPGTLFKFLIVAFIILTEGGMLISFAQEDQNNYVEIRGMVDQDFQPLAGGSLNLTENGKQVDRLVTGPSGTFSFKLDFNKIYIVSASKEGLVSKKIEFNTALPEGTSGKWVAEFAMSLFKPCKGLDMSVLEQPVAKIYFNEKKKTFEPDPDYSKKVAPRFDQLMEQNANCENDQYNQLIGAADKFMEKENYTQAKDNYLQALDLFPDDRYARKQIEKAEKLLAEQEASRKLYEQAVKQADEQFLKGNLTEAADAYKKALVIKSNEPYPVQQIKKIDQMLQEKAQNQIQKQQLEEQYQQALKQGETALTAKDYTGAVNAFKTALSVKAGDSFASAKLNEANELLRKYNEELAKTKETDTQYNELIQQGDKAFADKNYDVAVEKYQQALTVKSEEKYPQDQLTAIQKIRQTQQDKAAQVAEEKRKADFNQKVEQGDALLGEDKYQEAKPYFEQALLLKPGDPYVQSRISKIEKQIEKLKEDQLALEKEYNLAVSTGDNLFKLEEYAASKTAYQQAKSLKPTENYPTAQITRIDQLLAARQQADAAAAQKEQEYQKAVSTGDNLFKLEEYAGSKTAYQQAQTLKPAESYPAAQITRIDQLLAARQQADAAAAQKEQEYQKAVSTGDNLFKLEEYAASKTAYQQAQTLKPAESYPAAQITRIDQLLASRQQADAAAAQKEQEYQKAVSTGDNLFKMEEYAASKTAYQQAQTLKPAESYPAAQITRIDQLLAARQQADAAAAQKEQEYQKAVSTGDNLFKLEEYTGSKTAYQQAQTLKPAESYPAAQIARIDQLLAARQQADAAAAQKEQEYQKAVSRADKQFDNADYANAETSYEEALSIIPSEAYPKQKLARIKEIKEMLAKEQARSNANIPADPRQSVKKSPLKDLKSMDNSEIDKYLRNSEKYLSGGYFS